MHKVIIYYCQQYVKALVKSTETVREQLKNYGKLLDFQLGRCIMRVGEKQLEGQVDGTYYYPMGANSTGGR